MICFKYLFLLNSEMNVINYSEKSFVVTGDETKKYKEDLKKLGGKWNSNLSCGGGWIFSNKSKEEVEKFVESKRGLHSSAEEDDVDEPEKKIVSLLKPNKILSIPQQSPPSSSSPVLFTKFVEFLKSNDDIEDLQDVMTEYMCRTNSDTSLKADVLFMNFICDCKPSFKDYLTIKMNKESFIELALCYAVVGN